jgi:hypothetical protein
VVPGATSSLVITAGRLGQPRADAGIVFRSLLSKIFSDCGPKWIVRI